MRKFQYVVTVAFDDKFLEKKFEVLKAEGNLTPAYAGKRKEDMVDSLAKDFTDVLKEDLNEEIADGELGKTKVKSVTYAGEVK